jgi:hypothetical protein
VGKGYALAALHENESLRSKEWISVRFRFTLLTRSLYLDEPRQSSFLVWHQWCNAIARCELNGVSAEAITRSIRSIRLGCQTIFAICALVGPQSAADALTGVATAQVVRPSVDVGRGVAPVPYVGAPRAGAVPAGGTNDPGVDVIPRAGAAPPTRVQARAVPRRRAPAVPKIKVGPVNRAGPRYG